MGYGLRAVNRGHREVGPAAGDDHVLADSAVSHEGWSLAVQVEPLRVRNWRPPVRAGMSVVSGGPAPDPTVHTRSSTVGERAGHIAPVGSRVKTPTDG